MYYHRVDGLIRLFFTIPSLISSATFVPKLEELVYLKQLSVHC